MIQWVRSSLVEYALARQVGGGEAVVFACKDAVMGGCLPEIV